MGKALEVIDTFVTNPGVGPGLVATAPFPGDTLAIRSFDKPSRARLLDVWATAATTGAARIRSPRLHDNVQGIRFRDIAAQNRALLPDGLTQELYSQDVLITEMFGGAAETDGLSMLVCYDDLGGSDANLFAWEAIAPRIVNLVNVEVAQAAAAAVGARSNSVAISGTFDNLIGNTQYAILGYEVDANGLSIGIRGPDTGNYRLGGPMTTERLETRDWFKSMGEATGLPCIPVINSANKGGTLVDNAQVIVGVACNITLIMAELSA